MTALRRVLTDQYLKLGIACFGLNLLFKAAVVFSFRNLGIRDSFTSWDASWYIELARSGYPTEEFLNETAFQTQSTTGFFPLLSLVIRVLHRTTGISYEWVGIILISIFSVLAFSMVARLLSEYLEAGVVKATMVAIAISPGAFVFSMVYTEGLFVFLIALLCLCLRRDQILLAAVAASLAVITRPNGLLIFPMVGAFWWQKGRPITWRWLTLVVAPVVSFGLFLLYHLQHSGTAVAYFKNQKEGWNNYFDLGYTTIREFPKHFLNPLSDQSRSFNAEFAIVMIVLSILLAYQKVDFGLKLYAWGVVAMTLGATTFWSFPRMLTMAFPLFIPIGQRLKSWQKTRLIAVFAYPIWILVHGNRLVP